MPDVTVVKQDILDISKPSLSSTSDMPVIETKPDATNEGKPPEPKPQDKAAPAEGKPEEGTTNTEESATSPEESPASDEPKKAKGVQKRLDELTRQREEAKRQAEAERQEKLRLLALLEEKQKPKAEPDEGDPEPVKPAKDPANPDAYEAALEDYISKRAEWIARKEVKANLAEAEKKAEEARLAENARQAQATYTARVEKAQEKYPDYHEIAESPDVQVSIPMAHAITQAEDGPDIAYFLGKNPQEAERISKLAPPLQLVELGKISARLATPPAPTKPVSAAPAPGKPIKPTTETTPNPEEESMEAYANRRKKEWAAERRPGGARH